MKRFVAGSLLLLLAIAAAFAQNNPRIAYVYPAGGRQGTAFKVLVGGQFLNGVTNVYVSGEGVQAAVLEHTRPLTGREATLLRDQLTQLQNKRAAAGSRKEARNTEAGATNTSVRAWTAADERTLVEIRRKLALYNRKRQVSPGLAEDVIVEVKVARDAALGPRDFRLGTPTGLSNPLVFCVGDLPEVTQMAANVLPEAEPVRKSQGAQPGPAAKTQPDTNITLPAVINGQIMPGEVDRFRFKARKDDTLVFAASARALIPYLADAVPGWFQATLGLYDVKGREVAYVDDFQFHPDPVLFCRIPADGEYVLEVRDSIYRGREDFVYRISGGKLPFITSVFPLAVQPDRNSTLELTGWNLPQERIEVTAQEKAGTLLPISIQKDQKASNVRQVLIDSAEQAMEQEPNDAGNPQTVKLPVVMNGRIETPGDRDVYKLEGKAGDEVVIEVFARRLDTPLDSIVRVTDPAGRQLAVNDDFEDKGAGLTTHQADSRCLLRLPADGGYLVELADAQGKGGKEYAYRLRISPPRPDFELRVTPSTANIRGGSSAPLTVYVLRKDGFTNEIALALVDSPGLTLAGGRIPAGADQVKVTLAANWLADEGVTDFVLEGRARIGGEDIVHVAVPADDMTQAFAYHHLVPAQEMKVSVSGRRAARPAARILGEIPIKIPAGGTAKVSIGTPVGGFPAGLRLDLVDAPDGISIRKISAGKQGPEIELQSDPEKVKPGLRGNLIVNVTRPALAGKAKQKQGMQRRGASGALPAIPFEVVEPKQ